jgi:hypothetical protein
MLDSCDAFGRQETILLTQTWAPLKIKRFPNREPCYLDWTIAILLLQLNCNTVPWYCKAQKGDPTRRRGRL